MQNDNIIDFSAEGKAFCIKAYTFKNNNTDSNPTQYYSPGNTVIKGFVEGAKVTISQDGKSIASTTVKNGKAEFDKNLTPGNYSLTVEYDDIEIEDIFEIYSTIDADDEYKKAYGAELKIEVKFYDELGNALNNTSITGSVDNKNFTLTTDVNGSVTVDPNKLAIGTHELILLNPKTGEISFTTINIVSRFSNVNNIVMDYFDGTAFKVRVYDDFVNPLVKGQKVTITIKNKRYTAITDANGYVSFKIPNVVTPGTYTLKVTFAGQTISKTVKVKQVLKSKKTVTVKKSAKKLVLKATLKTSKNKALKNKKITFKFKGKTYKAKTDKKGIAKVTVKKNVIKKLKKGKKYTVKITYLKDTIKTTLKVKR